MDKNELIDKIVSQAEAILRGKLEATINKLDELAKESKKPKVVANVKITIEKKGKYLFKTKYKCPVTDNIEDESETESFDNDTPDFIDKAFAKKNK